MKKRFLLLSILCVCLLTVLSGCAQKSCNHSWTDATCKSPKTCSLCNETEGSPLAHTFGEPVITRASCDKPGQKSLTCQVCQAVESEEIADTFSAEEIYDLAKSSVGEILTFDQDGQEVSLGTCFVYGEDGKLLTNYHVMTGAHSAKVTLNGTEYDIKQVLAYDRDVDLALVKIDASDLSVLPICQKEHAVGKSIFALGSSQGLTATFSRGIITYAAREQDGVTYVQHDAAISSGNSGGPLINEYGEVIGINTLTVLDSQNLNFAISASELSVLKEEAPITLTRFFELECDPYLRLKEHIVEHGIYDIETEDYKLVLGEAPSEDNRTVYTRYAIYNEDWDCIRLFVSAGDGELFVMSLDPDLSGSYSWKITDVSEKYVQGTLSASSFRPSAMISFKESDINDTLLRNALRTRASAMIRHILVHMATDFDGLRVLPEDLGFTNY